jgi:polar amino acid transport system substrate-binding protein
MGGLPYAVGEVVIMLPHENSAKIPLKSKPSLILDSTILLISYKHCCRFFSIAILCAFGIARTYAANEGSTTPNSIPVLVVEQTDERGQIIPLSPRTVELFNYLENAAKIKFNLLHYPWRRLLKNGENGEGLVFGIYKTPERSQIFAFSEPVYSDKIWLVSRCADRMIFNNLQDLKGKTIGIIPGSSAGDEFDKQVNILFKPEYNTSNVASRFLKLQQKRMDAFLLYEPRTNVNEVQKELNQVHAKEIGEYKEKNADIFCILPKPVSAINVHFAVSLKTDKSSLEKIDKAIVQAKKSGELDRLFGK